MNDVIEFLRESNAIEGVYDELSLADAKAAWEYLIKQNVMTMKVILKTHAILMRNQPLRKSDIGAWRNCHVFVGTRRMLDPKLVPSHILMQFCLETMRVKPKPDWKRLHVVYETIHPFVDGNGRTGRMFMNWTRVKRCKLPILVVRESERQDYYQWFRE